MRRASRFYGMATLAALFVCALIAAGCGDEDETTTTISVGENAQQTVDEAAASCTDAAQQLVDTVGTKLEGACTYLAGAAKQVLSNASENVSQGFSGVARSCRNAVGQLPSGQAQDALSQFCDAVAGAE